MCCRIARALGIAMVAVLALAAMPQKNEEAEGLYQAAYRNCEHGWAVKLPSGVVAHGGDPKSARGFVVSPAEPATKRLLQLGAPRLIYFYDDFDSTNLGSPRAYFDQYDKEAPDGVTPMVRSIRETAFHGMPALYVRLSKAGPEHRDETEQIIAYQKNTKGLGPIFYILFLRSTPKDFAKDHTLFKKIADGFQVFADRHGACPEITRPH